MDDGEYRRRNFEIKEILARKNTVRVINTRRIC